MIIKKLASLCKESKELRLYATPGMAQWAGDAAAAYELSGIPAMGPGGLCAVMDIPGAYIVHEGMKLMPCTDGSSLVFIQPKYLGPLTDAESLTLDLRHTPGGQAYIVAKAGLFVVGVIMPATLDKNTLIWLGETYGLACEVERENEK